MVAQGKYQMFGTSSILVNEDIFKYNGQKIVKDNKVYRLEISPGQTQKQTYYFTGENSAAVSWMQSVQGKVTSVFYNDDNPSKNKIQADYRGKAYTIIAREVPLNETISFNFPVSAVRNECVDATYDMFAMPIAPTAFGLTTEDTDQIVIKYIDANSEVAIADLAAISENQLILATQLCTKLGANSSGSLAYDLQLLPYCPFEDLDVYYENHIYGPTYGKYVIDTGSYQSSDFTLIYDHQTTPNVQGIIFYPKHANFSKGVDYVIPNESVHYEWQELINPTLLAQGRTGDLTRWTIHEGFPYGITEGPWGIGPNDNNSNVDVEIDGEITNEDCEYLSLYSSPSLTSDYYKPFLSITSEDLPLKPANDYSSTYTLNGTVRVLAHWIVPDRPEDVKVKNECDTYRLTSPNFTSIYEFKKTKLKEGLKSFNIDCTYKPYSPYIKINPNYDDSFYAVQDFNDSMGLILSGDYSIPMLSDA